MACAVQRRGPGLPSATRTQCALGPPAAIAILTGTDERGVVSGPDAVDSGGCRLVPPIGRTRVAYERRCSSRSSSREACTAWSIPSFMIGCRRTRPALAGRAGMFVGMTLAILAGFGVRRLRWPPHPHSGRERSSSGWSPPLLSICAQRCRSNGCGRNLRQSTAPLRGHPTSCSPSFRWVETLVPGSPTRHTCIFPMALEQPNQRIQRCDLARGYTEFQEEMKQFPDSRTLDLLKARGTTHVSVTCALFKSGCDSLLKRIDAVSDLRLVSWGSGRTPKPTIRGRADGAITRRHQTCESRASPAGSKICSHSAPTNVPSYRLQPHQTPWSPASRHYTQNTGGGVRGIADEGLGLCPRADRQMWGDLSLLISAGVVSA